jgi:hypothetical protein
MTPTDKYLLVFVSLAAIIGLLSLVGHAVIAAAEHKPPATLEDARTGDRIIVPAGEVWRSTPDGWERLK